MSTRIGWVVFGGISLCMVALVIVFGGDRDSEPSRDLTSLRNDAMASWLPASTAAAQGQMEREGSDGLIQPVRAELLRTIRLNSDSEVLDQAVEAATNAGWTIVSRDVDYASGSKALDGRSMSISIVLKPAAAGVLAELVISIRYN